MINSPMNIDESPRMIPQTISGPTYKTNSSMIMHSIMDDIGELRTSTYSMVSSWWGLLEMASLRMGELHVNHELSS